MTIIQNIAYTTPLLGAIRIGHVEERNGKRIPQKDDHFTITQLHKQGNAWVKHELHDKLSSGSADKKLRSIPVKVIYSDADLNASERFEAYDRTQKRLVCAGDGVNAKQIDPATGKVNETECAGPAHCTWLRGQKQATTCGIFGRAIVKVEGQEDEFGGFILRYGSYNGTVSLRSRLVGLQSLFGDKLPHIPLTLNLMSKSSAMSMNSVFYFADLRVNGDPLQLAVAANEKVQAYANAGINYAQFETRMKALRDNGRFETDPNETFDDREEFLGESEVVVCNGDGTTQGEQGSTASSEQIRIKPFITKPRPKAGSALAGRLEEFVSAGATPVNGSTQAVPS